MYRQNMMTGVVLVALLSILHAYAAPTFDAIYPSPNSTASPSAYVQVTGWCAPMYAITNVEMWVDGVAKTPVVTGPLNYKMATWQPSVPFPSGSNVNMLVRFYDTSGSAETNFHFFVNADVTPPAITFRSPGETNNNVKIIEIEATATDESGMSTNVTLLVDGVPKACTVVRNGNSIIANWRSSLLATGAHVFVQMTVRDTFGNAANVQWHFDSTCTIEDWSDLNFSELLPAPQSVVVNRQTPISATINTRFDYGVSGVVMIVNGTTVTPTIVGVVDYRKTVLYTPITNFTVGTPVQVSLTTRDTGGRVASTSWWFKLELPPIIIVRSPGETNNNVKIIEIEVTATNEFGISTNVTLLVAGVTQACAVVQSGNSIIAQWRSSLLATGAQVFVQMTLRDTFGNTTNVQWHFDSNSTIDDWCNLHYIDLFPVPHAIGVDPQEIISATINTRFDYGVSGIVMVVSGTTVTPALVGLDYSKMVLYTPATNFAVGSPVLVSLTAHDTGGRVASTSWWFMVEAPPIIIYRSPGETNNNAKIIELEVMTTDETAISTNVTLLVDGVPQACAVVQSGNSINARWRSSLLAIGAQVFAQMTVRDIFGNATNVHWYFDSNSTSDDWCDLNLSGLLPAPQAEGVNLYSPISATIKTRLDYGIASIVMVVNGTTVTPMTVGVEYNKTVQYVPSIPFAAGKQEVALSARDTGGRIASTSWWFMVEATPTNEQSSVLLLNVWPQYAGPSQSVHVAWAQRDPGQVTLWCGTNLLYTFSGNTSNAPQMVSITSQQRAQWGLPAEGSNSLTAMHISITGEVTQRMSRAFFTVPNLSLATKANKTGTPDFDGDRIVVTYVGPGTPSIEGRTITVPGDAKAKLTVSTLVPKGMLTADGRSFIDSIIVSNGLKSFSSRNVSVGEIYSPGAGLGSVVISGGDLGRPSVVTILSNQVNGLLAARVASVLVKGGTIYGDVVVASAISTTPVSITCIAGKNKKTKLPEGGSFVNAYICTVGGNIKQIAAKGGAGFIVQPDKYRDYRTYGAVMAGASNGYVAQSAVGSIVPRNAILKVSMASCRWMGDWVTARSATGHKLTGAYPLREDTWYIGGTTNYYRWNGRN